MPKRSKRPIPRVPDATRSLRSDIDAAINRHGREHLSDTPDFILAQYLIDCLKAYEAAVKARSRFES